MKSPRRAAVSILRAWAKGHAYAENMIERHASRNALSAQDRNLLNAIVLGVLRHRRILDHWIAKLRNGKLDPETRDILRVGLTQLLILELPDHAAVFETVELGKSSVRGLLNAVMRRASAQKDKLMDFKELPPAVIHSHPDWLYKRWKKEFGAADTEKLMIFNNTPAPTYLSNNPLHPSRRNEHVPGTLPESSVLEGPIPHDLLKDGAVYIQDPATRHCVELLAPKPGEEILDACAAPGGKAYLIAAMQGGASHLTCTDSNEKRLPRLRENLERLHAGDAKISCHDWTQPAPSEWHGKFDGILLDVPCSNTGVFRRRVDVRWRLQAPDIENITVTQRQILENALPCLKPEGRLVYSTCSIEEEENSGLMKKLLAAHPELELIQSHQALPHIDGTDGAYAALIQRKTL
jgi:16S rRNA (cytosine967-C5)-methyltransferase